MRRPFEVGETEEERCRACRREAPRRELDERGWCETCRSELARRVSIGQHLVAALVTLPFAIWIAVEGVEGFLPLYAWAIPLAAAYWLGMRIGREVLRGAVAARRARERETERGSNGLGAR